ncbi:transcription termination/antitermination NusG family protein [Methylocystis sp. IM3]|uniref:transcription termination/antitermination protein NusG n=1 Tax=unclassified Methylocystis TaxID=2625913 RepID=UPI0030F5368B
MNYVQVGFTPAEQAARRKPTAKLLREGERWYAAQTLANRETGALLHLNAQGFRTFLPVSLRTVSHARKLKTVRRAVFPGYLFLILDLQRDRWRSVNGTSGVSRLVMGRDYPLAVPEGVVETLLDCVDEQGLCTLGRDLREGEKVRVISGPLAQAMGQLVNLDDKGRVRVLLEIMGGEVLTTMERCVLERA